MTTFSDWLKSELLRLKSFDWQQGSWNTRSQPDGTMKFSSHYSLEKLAREYGISVEEIVKAVEQELTGKQFTVERKEDAISLSWTEDGIREWKTDITMDYSRENTQVPGKIKWTNEHYQKSRLVERIIYLDGKERVLKEIGPAEPVKVSKETFDAVVEQIKQANATQTGAGEREPQDEPEPGNLK